MNLSPRTHSRTTRLIIAALGMAFLAAPVMAHHATPAPASTPWYLPPATPAPAPVNQ